MRLHRRALHPEPGLGGAGDCHGSDGYGCPSPPLPPHAFDTIPSPSPAPSASPFCWPSWPQPCPPVFAPSPSPVHGATAGRRDQGGSRGYGPPAAGGGGGDDHSRRFVTYVLIAAAAIAFVSLILLGVSVAVRRRQVRRRRQALLAPAAAANVDDGGNDPEEGGGSGGGGVVHHVWYIRTVGLDEAAIASIAATRYRAGAGLLGVADCTVCLGEFQDGELVRLLPKCGHAFHIPCIDTWLRAHVNCPLCRSDVLDPAVTTTSGGGGSGESSSNPPAYSVANADAAAEQAAAASDAIPEHEEEESDQEASPAEEDRQEQSSPPEPLPQLPCPPPRNVRRAASMDAAVVSAAADVAALHRLPEAAPEQEQSGRRKRGAGLSSAKASGSGHRSNLSIDRPASGGIPRPFFSRHCRARSLVLPL